MKVYDLHDPNGHVFAFEVENIFLSRRGVVRVVRAIPGVVVARTPRLFSWLREEEFCEFVIDGQTFVAWESFGDNSRYWIGPKPPHWCEQLTRVREAFSRWRPLFGLAAG